MTKILDLLKEDELFAGVDPGNTSTKVSYLNQEGNIESFAIPTVMAPAPATAAAELSNSELTGGQQLRGEDVLHVQIISDALPANHRRNYYYVGRYAMDREGMVQPEDGALKSGSELMTVTDLTSLAVAALRLGKSSVRINYSGGIPIGEYQEVGQSALDKLFGKHRVIFIDGPFSGGSVLLDIYAGTMRVEGVNSVLGLGYDIQQGKLLTTPLAEEFGIQSTYALADLGAGTADKAYYRNGKIDKNISTNAILKAEGSLGTNAFIDQLMKNIVALDNFAPIRKALGEADASLYRNREEFVDSVIAPGVERLLQGEGKEENEKNVLFTASWARVKDVNITALVLESMNNYAHRVKEELDHFWYVKAKDAERFGLVGGGVLFGYYYFRDMAEYTLPSPEIIRDAAFITARSYLIALVGSLQK
ncbi:hypothetical protein [Sporolactobacillus sp. KGMB 08714]|uniref:ParM/StbA family protein n=1 Tax=Sporolactobacillus sp. KGMB 08714 TaxID=3064704 RepID=UPI002FBDCFA4